MPTRRAAPPAPPSPTTLTLAEQIQLGRSKRHEVPRGSLADWQPAPDRLDPVEILVGQDQTRSADLVPIRHGRMDTGAFPFYRGAAAVMAADLASVPVSGLRTQICGDAHLSNLGVYASPERRLLFDLNDFDETLPGPWEWDVARLTASFAVAARAIGASKASDRSAAAIEAARSYRTTMADFAAKSALETWYSRLDVDDVLATVSASASKKAVKRAHAEVAKTRTRTSLQAAKKLTRLVDGRLRIIDDPPLLVPLSSVVADEHVAAAAERVRDAFRQYRESLAAGPREVLSDYEFVDIGHKVVGVGSVGMRAFIVVLQSRRTAEPLLLQIKEATASVLEAHLAPSVFEQPGQRVVEGQRMMQAASDLFLGWSSTPSEGRHYYWRQLRDMKGSAEIELMTPAALTAYARMCGWSLARAHARSGPAAAIAAYLGSSDRFDRAMGAFALRYAGQNDADHAAHHAAVEAGRLPVLTGY